MERRKEKRAAESFTSHWAGATLLFDQFQQIRNNLSVSLLPLLHQSLTRLLLLCHCTCTRLSTPKPNSTTGTTGKAWKTF